MANLQDPATRYSAINLALKDYRDLRANLTPACGDGTCSSIEAALEERDCLLSAMERAAEFLEIQAEHYERNLRRCWPEDEWKYKNGAVNYRNATNDARAAIAKAHGE